MDLATQNSIAAYRRVRENLHTSKGVRAKIKRKVRFWTMKTIDIDDPGLAMKEYRRRWHEGR